MTIDLESSVVYDLENDVDYDLENEGADVTTTGLLTVAVPAYTTVSHAAQAVGLLPVPTGALATDRRKDLTPAAILPINATQLASARKDTVGIGLLTAVAQAQSVNTSRGRRSG